MTTRFLYLLLFLLITNTPSTSLAHGGALDKNGGHTDRKSAGYHCHKQPCLTIHQKAQDALNEAGLENRDFIILYDRQEWPHWIDGDLDCQDTRAEVLISTSRVPVKFKRNKGCIVSWGEWFDPYTGKTFNKASNLDIDHIVPLKEAHRSGGYAWSKEQRRAFANDPENLTPVDLHSNRQKSDRDPANWAPPNKGYICEYLKRWTHIKHKYRLASDENEAMKVNQLQTEMCLHNK